VRLRIVKLPPVCELDGVRVDRYRVGLVYDMSTRMANVFLSEGWAEPVIDGTPARVLPPRDSSAVLVVEDDPDMRAITVELLTLKGYVALAAKNGEEALRLLTEHRPALVLLDLMMPVMDGWQFRAAQRKLSDRQLACVPVVLLTAVPGAQRHRRELGAVTVIEKPVTDFDELVETVRRCLDTAESSAP
jgi:CheY-like chemotaxis protein